MSPPQKTVAIYARVSTDKQAVDMQLSELRDFVKRSNWKICKEYIDQGYTGANTKRPAFTDMMNQARKRKFDILLVWKLDRLSRSLKDLINTLDELARLSRFKKNIPIFSGLWLQALQTSFKFCLG